MESNRTDAPLPADMLPSLRDDIVSGALPNGTPLREEAVAARFGVSRTPARMAIHCLIREGVLDRETHHSAVVHTLTRTEVTDLTEMHECLDLIAVRQAAVRRSEADLRRLRADVMAAGRAEAAVDPLAVMRAGGEFRRHTYHATGNRPLCNVEGAFRTRTRRLIALSEAQAVSPAQYFRRLLAAFEARDSDAAESVMADLLKRIRRTRPEHVLPRMDEDIADTLSAPTVPSAPEPSVASEPSPADVLRVVSLLREQIIDGTRAPGERLGTRRVAAELGVSRAVAVDALELLRREGLVTTATARSAARVHVPCLEESDDLLDVVATMTTRAARIAVQRPATEECRRLHDILTQEKVAWLNNDSALIEHMFAFRRHILAMADNKAFLEADELLNGRLRLQFATIAFEPLVLRGHQLLYGAISARDPALAEKIHRETLGRIDRRGRLLQTGGGPLRT
ncbi:GntR family transcriptional regulator [Microbacterium resistens]